MKIKSFISSALFIAGILLCAVGIVILEVLNFRKATAYDPGFDVGVWISMSGIAGCPQNGHAAHMNLYKDSVHIDCKNYDCTVKPFVVAYSEEEAAAKWNTRTKPIKRVRSRISEKENRADS